MREYITSDYLFFDTTINSVERDGEKDKLFFEEDKEDETWQHYLRVNEHVLTYAGISFEKDNNRIYGNVLVMTDWVLPDKEISNDISLLCKQKLMFYVPINPDIKESIVKKDVNLELFFVVVDAKNNFYIVDFMSYSVSDNDLFILFPDRLSKSNDSETGFSIREDIFLEMLSKFQIELFKDYRRFYDRINVMAFMLN